MLIGQNDKIFIFLVENSKPQNILHNVKKIPKGEIKQFLLFKLEKHGAEATRFGLALKAMIPGSFRSL